MADDCPICQVSLGCAAFQQTSDDTEVSENVFRLKCGHAFHNGCLCRALRLENGCPLCRTAAIDGDEEDITEMDIVVDADGNLQLRVSNDDGGLNGAPAMNVEEAREALDLMDTARRDPSVQRARAEANRAKQRYRRFEAELQKARRKAVSEAVDGFRGAWRDKFESERRSFRRALRRVRRAEINAIEKASGLEGREKFLRMLETYRPTDYCVEGPGYSSFGPLKRKFWAV